MENLKEKIEEAVAYMKQSTSVKDWNDRRKVVFESFDKPYPELIQAIDGAGMGGRSLIVETLGQD
jgi:hypothetical protein